MTNSDASTGGGGWKYLFQKSPRQLHNKVILETFSVFRGADTCVEGDSELAGHSLPACKAFLLQKKHSLKRRSTISCLDM